MKIVITVEVPDGAAVSVGTDESVATAKPAKGKTKAAPESAPPAPVVATSAATAPAAVLPPVVEAPTLPTLQAVNKIVSDLAGKDRDAAVAILLAHGAAKVKTSTSQLKPEVYQVVIDETEEAIAKFDAAATQVASSGSLV